MKKSLLFALTFIGILTGTLQGFSQETTNINQHNYFVLTRNVQQLKPIVLAAADLAEIDGENYGEFHVVICGQAVMDLADSEKMEPYLQLAKDHQVKLIACGFSLSKFEVNKDDLPPGMEVVQNGILYGFNLEKQGFYSITL